MQAEYDERARRAKAANEVDVKNQSDAIAAAEQRHKMDKETMEAKMLKMAKKRQVEAAAAASKKASDEAIAAAKKKAETKVAAGDVAPPMAAGNHFKLVANPAVLIPLHATNHEALKAEMGGIKDPFHLYLTDFKAPHVGDEFMMHCHMMVSLTARTIRLPIPS